MRVTVVGAGVIGLVNAARLADSGHRVTVVAAEPPAQTTSAVAAAIWYPYRAFPQAEVIRWSAATYQVLGHLATVAGTGVRMLSGRELLRNPSPAPWWRSAVGTLDRIAESDLPPGYRDGWRLVVPAVDMARHLTWLQDQLDQCGVPIHERRVEALAELAHSADAVVNCTGLGASTLLPDPQVTPVRGQVVVVEQFGLAEWLLDQSDPDRLTYLVPREDTVILGGTAQEGSDDLVPSPEIAEAILERCTALVPAVAGARIVAHRVGLRPARPSVRLELQQVAGLPVVHCYGHGGAGVTLSHGCADDVVRIIDGLT